MKKLSAFIVIFPGLSFVAAQLATPVCSEYRKQRIWSVMVVFSLP